MRTLLLITLLCCSSLLYAEIPSKSGNAFLRVCSSLEKDESTQLLEMEKVVGCAVYVSGFLDGVSFGTAFAEDKAGRKLPSPFCFPDAIDTGQIMRIVLKYIREHPEEAHERTAVLLVRALRQAYPCPK